MADTTLLPSSFILAQWSRPTSAATRNPQIAQDVSAADTVIYFNTPLRDATGAIPTTKAILIAVITDNCAENMYVAAGGLAADGLSATVTRGINLEGLDYTTSQASLVVTHNQGDPVYVATSGVFWTMMYKSILGTIATGGANFKIGRGVDEDIKIFAFNGDASLPFIEYDTTTSRWLYSDDGVSSTPFGTGAGVTGGDGITVTAGDIDIDLTDTVIFKSTSAGAGDSGKVSRLDVAGLMHQSFMPDLTTKTTRFNDFRLNSNTQVTADSDELNKLDGTGVDVNATNLNTLTNNGNASSLHYHITTQGVAQSPSGTVTQPAIAHGLGNTPRWIEIFAVGDGNGTSSAGTTMLSDGRWDGTNYSTVFSGNSSNSGVVTAVGTSTAAIMYIQISGTIFSATLTADGTNINITWSSNTNAKVSFKWKAGR